MGRISFLSLRHPLSLLGASIATVGSVLIIGTIAAELTGYEPNPYFSLFALIALPALLVFGLLLIPIGAWLSARRAAHPYPVLDINRPSHRTGLVIFLALTVVNVVILAAAGFSTVEYVDSPSFCGQVCHAVMHPEYAAWHSSPHAEVRCVSCHVGPGARGFVRAKLNGIHQLMGVISSRYERPIPSPVKSLRPARETCERCHWAEQMHGDRLVVKRAYSDDVANTPQTTVLMLKVGGGTAEDGSGIHWHMNVANKVIYVPTDGTRQVIPWVQLTDRAGKVTEYLAAGAKRPSDAEVAERGRQMDCVDCHNRPAHQFVPAHTAVDDSISAGRLPRDLPFIRKYVLGAVSGEYPDTAAAETGITQKLKDLYEQNHQDVAHAKADEITKAAAEAVALYRRNVFPEMRIAWGSYSSMIGHTDSNGCFRCHDGAHKTADGVTLNDDCGLCHAVVAVEEPQPEILKQLNP